MPGLFGWIDLARHDGADSASDAPAMLSEMAQRMSHVGGELVETWLDPPRGFAIARLTPRGAARIAWPSPSGGALREHDRAFVDGVLHGADEHVETRLADLARRGPAALTSLCGFFTAARYSPARRSLMLAVDRRASRPLAFTIAGGRLFFAPEVKALLVAPGFDKTIDDAAIGVFLGSGYVLAHQTLFAGTRRLCAGEALLVEDGRARVEAYHRHALSARGDGTRPRDLEQEMAEVVRGAVERNLAEPRRTVVFLSGGVDSRAIAEAAQATARRRGEQISTLTWASPRAQPGSDLHVAQRVAEALGTRHRAVLRQVTAWGARLTEVTYLLDGLTDVPAYHGYEYAVMRELAKSGTRIVLRGDECFGWLGRVGSVEQALLSLNLRALGTLRLVDRVVRPEAYTRWCEASEEALAEAARPFAGAPPDDVKDQLYFRHRLGSYLGSAAYLKHVTLDHRAPLLDEALLDLIGRVPAAHRADKRLFCRAAARGAPELWRIPLARRGNLEDWEVLLASASPVRAHVEAELADTESAAFQLFDRAAVAALLPPRDAPPSRSFTSRVTRGAKMVARAALRLSPGVERAISVRRQRAGIRPEQVVMRVMVLKAWHDLFVTGDGSRRALERRVG